MRRTLRSSGFGGKLVRLALSAGISAGIASGCGTPAGDDGHPAVPAAGGSTGSGGSSAGGGGSAAAGGGSGGAGPSGSGGTTSEGTGGSSSPGTGGDTTGGSGGSTADAGGEGGASGTPDSGSAFPDSNTPMNTDGGPIPSYDGEIPLFHGPPVGPEVKMACPGDPTQGFTEYTDTFHVERPYDIPINTRFKIEGGIHTFWVLPGDKPHSATTAALNPRTEARFSQNFTTGIRLFSADVMLEKSTDQVVVMQVHTTATGIGPVYLHVEGDALAGSSVKSSDIPGGLFDNWFNLKVIINAATTQSQIFINNCLKTTQNGTRGDGNDYFKMGVYHCKSTLCRDHYKNVRLYMK